MVGSEPPAKCPLVDKDSNKMPGTHPATLLENQSHLVASDFYTLQEYDFRGCRDQPALDGHPLLDFS